jgi:hypothetical protein
MLAEWVLILTIATTQSAVIHSIPMYSITACNIAGEAWASTFKDKQTRGWVCVSQR